MPTFWQMRSGERRVTVTMHEMAPRLDAGAVLGTAECPIGEHDTLDRLMIAAKHEGARLAIRVLSELSAGKVKRHELDMADAAYYSFPRHADVTEFRRQGHRLI